MGRTPDPMWAHTEEVQGEGNKPIQDKWKCKYCGGIYAGSATRVRSHVGKLKGKGIAICSQVPQEIVDSLRASMASMEEKESEGSISKRRKEMDVDSQGSGGAGTSSSMYMHVPVCGAPKLAPVNPFKKGTVKASLQKQAMAEATREITRLFIQCALSFNLLKTKRWKSCIKAISRIGVEWEGPTYEALRTRELRKERMQVEKDVEPLRATWEKYGCTIICDGWSDVRKRNVYNILVASCKGNMFLRAIDASQPGTVVTGEFIWRHLREAVLEVGPQNIVQIITDNGSNCVSMGKMLEEEFPKKIWTPCASHSLDLLMEDIGKMPWVSTVLDTAKFIVKFVTKRPKVLNIFRVESELQLQKPSSTRFAYMFIVVDRVLRVRPGLLRTIVSRSWLAMTEVQKRKPNYVKFELTIMGDETFWKKAQTLITVLQPLYSVLRITDMEGCTLGLLYEYMDKIGECINKAKGLEETEVDGLRDAWLSRWDWFHRPIHAVAHILHPLWRDDKQYDNDELEDGWNTYIDVITEGDVQKIKQLEHERLLFRNSTGRSLSTATARLRECQLEPVSWWEKYGSSTPNLRRLAMRVLSQDCSSGPCERNWSTWSLFHTKRRNKLSLGMLERLVYCHCNLRLLEEKGNFVEPRQVNVDLIDIEKVNPIPEIPPEEKDIYAMLYEEATRSLRATRSRSRVRVRVATTTTPAASSSRGATRAGASTSRVAVAEIEETQESNSDDSDESSASSSEEEVSDEEIDADEAASDA